MRTSNRESNSNSKTAKRIKVIICAFSYKDRSIKRKGRTRNQGRTRNRGGLERAKTGRFLYVHPGISKGGIQRKHISFLWVGREGLNEETISFSMKWCVFWLSHLPYYIVARNQGKTIIISMIFYERFQQTTERIIQ